MKNATIAHCNDRFGYTYTEDFDGTPAEAGRWISGWYGRPQRIDAEGYATVYRYVGFMLIVRGD